MEGPELAGSRAVKVPTAPDVVRTMPSSHEGIRFVAHKGFL
jgi:hypothetical protein